MSEWEPVWAKDRRIITGPLATVARRYGVNLVYNNSADGPTGWDGWVHGPQMESLHMGERAVVYSDRSSPEGVLHELVHVVMGPESIESGSCESYILFPFEWALVKYVERMICRDDAAEADRFVRLANVYQTETSVISGLFSLDSFGDRVGPLWKKSRRLAIEAGLITERSRPTFRVPDWSRVPARMPESWITEWHGWYYR